MPRLFPRIDVRKVQAGTVVNIDVLFWTTEGTPLTGQGSVSLVIRRGSDGFYWNGATFITGYRVIPMAERGSNPHQEGVYRYTFATPKSVIPREDTYDWSVERVSPDNRTYLQKGRINALKTGIVGIPEGGVRAVGSISSGTKRLDSDDGRHLLIAGDGFVHLLAGACQPTIIASTITNRLTNPTWDLRPYQGLRPFSVFGWGPCCSSFWRVVEICTPNGPVNLLGGSVACNGVLEDLPDEFVTVFSYDGCVELQTACVDSSGNVEWP